VGHDAGQLGSDYAKNLAPLRDLDSEQPLSAQRKGDVVADRVEIVLSIRPADDLVVLPVLADFLEAAVQVADVRDAPDDGLAIQLQHESENTVCSRMLRTDVDEHVLTFEIRLDARRCLDGDRCASIVRNERNTLWPALRVEA
jgi:hypothetical protein